MKQLITCSKEHQITENTHFPRAQGDIFRSFCLRNSPEDLRL